MALCQKGGQKQLSRKDEVDAAMVASPNYTPEMPSPTPYANLKCLGFNARERERLRVFQRLSHLTGLAEKTDPGSEEAEYTLAKQLASMVVTGGNCADIVSARERVARLLSIAKDLLMEVQYLQDNPQEAKAIEGADEQHFAKLRDELFALCRELEGRAGEPEPMQTAAAERMRQKLEAKLLPKFNTEIPKWAERLRFLHAEVLKWRSPDHLLDPEEAGQGGDAEDPEAKLAAEAAAQAAERELLSSGKKKEKPAVVNPPRPKAKELELLRAMGWTPEDDNEEDMPDEANHRSAGAANGYPGAASGAASGSAAPDPAPDPAPVMHSTSASTTDAAPDLAPAQKNKKKRKPKQR